MQPVQAVLLDMDGTLVDSVGAVERAWRRWAEEYHLAPDEVLAVAHGVPAEATAARFLPGRSPAEVQAAAARQLSFQYDDLADVAACAGAHQLLAVLDGHGIPWAVVTSADRRLARARLTAAAIEAPLLITSEDVVAGKPDPACYLLAAHRLHVTAVDCLVVEDSPAGLAAGIAAGARTVLLRGTAAPAAATEQADLVVDDLLELAALIDAAYPRP